MKSQPIPIGNTWQFRTLPERISECRLLCKQQGMNRKQTSVMVGLVRRMYSDLLKVEQRRVEFTRKLHQLEVGERERWEGKKFYSAAPRGPRK